VEEVAGDGDRSVLADVAAALIALRGAKSQAKVSMKTEIVRAELFAPAESLARLQQVAGDLRDVGRITGELSWTEAPAPLRIDVTLAEAQAG
jgi:valyl-tRNA synthetase